MQSLGLWGTQCHGKMPDPILAVQWGTLTIVNKMATGAIRVCVLEGIYAKMTELGLSLSLTVELQYHGLRLD